jgi:hypothetical protein
MGKPLGIFVAIAFALAACSDDPTITSGPTAGSATASTASTASAAFPVTVTGTNGEVTIDTRPERIVSLSPTATEDLFAIGAGDQVIAVDDQSNYPVNAPTTDLSGFTVEARRAGWDALARRARQSRTWGDCYGYLLVATGRAEAMLDPVMNLWDSACLQPIIVEAGGRFTSWEGVETAAGGSAVATNALLADEVRRLLAAP